MVLLQMLLPRHCGQIIELPLVSHTFLSFCCFPLPLCHILVLGEAVLMHRLQHWLA